MNQTKVTACHDDTINRVLQENHIQPGNMIEYLESRLHYIQCSGLDLKHEVEMGCADQMEPGFYEKLFAELNAETEMLKSIIAKLKGGVMDSAPKQTELGEVIDCLECFQTSTIEDISIFRKEIEIPASIHNNAVAQAHFKMLLDGAIHESDCLKVVIEKLKWEQGFESDEDDEDDGSQQEIEPISEEAQAEIDECLAAIRKRREEAREAMKGGV